MTDATKKDLEQDAVQRQLRVAYASDVEVLHKKLQGLEERLSSELIDQQKRLTALEEDIEKLKVNVVLKKGVTPSRAFG